MTKTKTKVTKALIVTFLVFLITTAIVLAFTLHSSSEEVDYSKMPVPDRVIDIANGDESALYGMGTFFDRYDNEYNDAGFTVPDAYKINFKSDGRDSTHQYIPANALVILNHDIGGSIFNNTSYSSTLLDSADKPDKDEIGGFFCQHFYNPYTEKDFVGSTDTTGKTQAVDHYNNALNYYRNGNVSSAMDELGRGLHYVADICEVHHANNLTAIGSNHSAYEKYCDDHEHEYKIINNTFDQSVYEEAKHLSVGQIVRNHSYASYTMKSQATGNKNNLDYALAARESVKNAIYSATQYIYKFGVEVGIYS